MERLPNQSALHAVLDRSGGADLCLLCGGSRHHPIFDEFGVDVLRCDGCGHVFSSFPAQAHFDGFWGDDVTTGDHSYWGRSRVKMHHDFFRRFMTTRTGRLLDIGCGLGFFVHSAALHTGWQTVGCEISPAAVRYARDTLGLNNIICGRPEDLELPPASFDIVTMWDVLEHLKQPDGLLRRCHSLLRQGGLLFVRTPNVTVQLLRARIKRAIWGARPDLAYLMARDHCHHYSTKSIRALLERNGFSNIQFAHLRPIGATAGGSQALVRFVKDTCFAVVRAFDVVSFGHINLDNLFVVAHK